MRVREPYRPFRLRHAHRRQHHVRRDRKKRRLGKTQATEIPGRARMTRPAHRLRVQRGKKLHSDHSAEQRHETDPFQHFVLITFGGPGNTHQDLLVTLADRQHHAPSGTQLFDQRQRDTLGCRGHDNPVEWGVLGQTEPAIDMLGDHVADLQTQEAAPRLIATGPGYARSYRPAAPAAPAPPSGNPSRFPPRARFPAGRLRAKPRSCAPRYRAAKSSGLCRSAARCPRRRDSPAPRRRTGGAAYCGYDRGFSGREYPHRAGVVSRRSRVRCEVIPMPRPTGVIVAPPARPPDPAMPDDASDPPAGA